MGEIETIKVRIRLCIYKDHLGGYSYFVDDTSEMSPTMHTVWLEADVPVKPIPIQAQVIA